MKELKKISHRSIYNNTEVNEDGGYTAAFKFDKKFWRYTYRKHQQFIDVLVNGQPGRVERIPTDKNIFADIVRKTTLYNEKTATNEAPIKRVRKLQTLIKFYEPKIIYRWVAIGDIFEWKGAYYKVVHAKNLIDDRCYHCTFYNPTATRVACEKSSEIGQCSASKRGDHKDIYFTRIEDM